MAAKRAFLLTGASCFELQDVQNFYDEKQQLNLVARSDDSLPLVATDGFARTESKTHAAPGDDDPDPEDEGCY